MNMVLYSLSNFLIPAAMHLLVLYAFTTVDPCKGNPGCMAGSATAFFLILVTLPTLLFLLFAAIFRYRARHRNHTRQLMINLALALAPFPLVALVALTAKVLT